MPDGRYACAKCKHGKGGLVVNFKVDNCEKYDDAKRVCE